MTDFPEFWNPIYPHPGHKGNKQTARLLYETLTDKQREDMLTATEEYKIGLAAEPWRAPMQMTRWLRNPGEWEGPLEQAQERAGLEAAREASRERDSQERAERRRVDREEAIEAERARPGNLAKIEDYLRKNGARRR